MGEVSVERRSANRPLLRSGYVLVLLGLLTGVATPLFRNPRMGLSAHLTGFLAGILVVVLALSWRHLQLSARVERTVEALARVAGFGTWAASVLAAVWGTSRLTPIAGAGHTAAAWQELLTRGLAIAAALATIGTVGFVIRALHDRPADAS
jgi:hydroxylaminobenzene mutase